MSRTLNSCDLIETSLRRGMIPKNCSTFSCCDILEILNEEMDISLIPTVMRFHEEYYVYEEDVCIVSCVIHYQIPYRAVGNKLRGIFYVDDSDNHYEMTRTCIENRADYTCSYGVQNRAYSFYPKGDEIVLMDCSVTSGKLRMIYYLRPNKLVKESKGAKIKSVTICACCCTTTFSLCSYPDHFSCTTCFDIIQGKTSHKIKVIDVTPTAKCAGCVASNIDPTVTFSTCDLKRLNIYNSDSPLSITFCVGDYLMAAQETVYPQIPVELQPILAQRAAIHMLDALGDIKGVERAEKKLEQMEYNMGTIIDNRVEGETKKIVNRKGILWRTINSRRRLF